MKGRRKTSEGKLEAIFEGHEVWLEPVKNLFHEGEEAVVKAGWGHGMKTDGLGEKEKWNAYFLTPAKRRLELSIQESEKEEEFYLLSFIPEEKGFYTIVVENDFGIGTKLKSGDFMRGPKRDYENAEYSIYFYQYAKAVVPVDVDPLEETYEGKVGNELEIVPLNLNLSRLQREGLIEFEVIYEEKLFPEAKLEGTYSTFKGKDFPLSTVTNQDGRAELSVDKKDNWMFRVDYVDETKSIEGFYDKIHLRATLTISTKKVKI